MRRSFVAMVVAIALATSCAGRSSTSTTGPADAPGAPAGSVQYGPAREQFLRVLAPSGPAVGVIVYAHGGGWCCGDIDGIDRTILDAKDAGWAVVTIDYRRSPTFHLDDIASDVDRAVRFVKSKRAEWGFASGKLLVSGYSAGGHLALLQASAPGEFVAADLPEELRAIDPHVDGVISYAGPSDLRPYIDHRITSEGIDAPKMVEDLLGCAGTRCTDALVRRGSPLDWARLDVAEGEPLPPAFLSYGDRDTLVPAVSQGEPIARVWASASNTPIVVFDREPQASHNISDDIDRIRFRQWLTQFV